MKNCFQRRNGDENLNKQALIDNGIVSQDLFDTFRGIKLMFEDAIAFVENGEEDYTTAVDKETWIKIWIE